MLTDTKLEGTSDNFLEKRILTSPTTAFIFLLNPGFVTKQTSNAPLTNLGVEDT